MSHPLPYVYDHKHNEVLCSKMYTSSGNRVGGRVHNITPRQREVLALVAQGRSNESIAAAPFLTERAVVQQRSNIDDALGIPLTPDDHRRVLAVIRDLEGPADWPGGVGLAEFHLMDRMVEAGRAAARALLEQTGGVFTADLP